MENDFSFVGPCSNLVKSNGLEARAYQINIIRSIIDNGNTLVVLPTGLGKTLIAVFSIACALYNGKKALMLAPTKPLSEQHFNSLRSLLNINDGDILLLTGKLPIAKRKALEEKARIIIATPQTVANDLKSSNFEISQFGIAIFDEVHRAVGRYAYTYVADKCKENNIKMVGLTASPGNSRDKVMQLIDTLGIDNIEVRTPEDPDVAPYVKEKNVSKIDVEKGETVERISLLLKGLIEEHLYALFHIGLCPFRKLESISKMRILDIGKSIDQLKSSNYKFIAIFHYIYVLDLLHAYDLVTTEGIQPFVSYIDSIKNKEKKSRSVQSMLKNKVFLKAMDIAENALKNGEEHPKMKALVKLITDKHIDNKIIIFAQYRYTISKIVEILGNAGLKAKAFVGKKDGVTQDQQMQVIKDFRDGKFNILVATSIGEEGLDIPSVDTVIFYEPITSSIRSIQRKGRTGRFNVGNIYVLIAKGTKDETYFMVSSFREKKMYDMILRIKHSLEKMPKPTTSKAGQKRLF